MLASTMEEGGVPKMSRDHVPLIPAMEEREWWKCQSRTNHQARRP